MTTWVYEERGQGSRTLEITGPDEVLGLVPPRVLLVFDEAHGGGHLAFGFLGRYESERDDSIDPPEPDSGADTVFGDRETDPNG